MTSRTLPITNLSAIAPGKRDLLRATIAGVAFSAMMTAGFAAMSIWQCGGICIPELAENAGLSMIAGFIGLGPLAVYGRRV